MDDLLQATWSGGKEPTSFPHLCPYRIQGMDRKACLELSGGNMQQNMNGCCGTYRSTQKFAPCNSAERRCIVCLEIGRRGLRAHIVTDVATGKCSEHAAAKVEVF